MKKKIISFTLCLIAVLGFIMTPFSVFAAADTSSDTLIEELSTNIPGFDPDEYPANANGSPMIIGTTIFDEYTQGMHYTYTGTSYSVYVYNPSERPFNHASGLFKLTAIAPENTYYTDLNGNEVMFYKDNYSYDHRFYKFTYKINIPDQDLYDYEIRFELDYFALYTENQCCRIDQNHVSSFKYDHELESYQIKTNSFGKKELDVNLTSYVVGTVDADITKRYEVFTAYFSIPDQYIRYYDALYSVSASYVKKQTYPIVWSEDPATYDIFNMENVFPGTKINRSWLSENYLFQDLYNGLFSYSGINVANGNNTGFIEHSFLSKDLLGVVSNGDPSYEYIVEYLESQHVKYPDRLLYFDAEKVTSTKTVDQSFDVTNFYDSASYVDYYFAYGADIALLRWLYEYPATISYMAGPIPGVLGSIHHDALKEIVSGFCDFDQAGERLDNSPYLVVLSDADRVYIQTASNADISKKYLIHENQVESFKEYVKANPYTVLYRYDICEAYSDKLVEVELDYEGTYQIKGIDPKDDYEYYISRRFHFADFEVINVTFEEENEYISVCTRSVRKNYTPGFDYNPIDPPVFDVESGFNNLQNMFDNSVNTLDDTVDGLLNKFGEWFGGFAEGLLEKLGVLAGGAFDGFFDNLLGDWAQYIKPVLIAIGIILLILFFVWVGRSVAQSNFFNVYFQGKSASHRSKELKLRRSEAKARREEHRDDVSLRREQNAIRKREATIKELDNKARNENTSKANAIKERDQERRFAREEAAEKARQKEERRKAREAKKAEKEKAERDKKAQQAKYNNYSTEDAFANALNRTYDDKK